MNKIISPADLLARVESAKKDNPLDLTSAEDLSIGVMNLISIEEHLFFTIEKTSDEKFLDLLNNVRKLRIEAMKKLVKDEQGEAWCIGKHLLAASMRLMEVGTKALKNQDKKSATYWFQKSFDLYTLFWEVVQGEERPETKALPGRQPNLANWLKKALDCCKE